MRELDHPGPPIWELDPPGVSCPVPAPILPSQPDLSTLPGMHRQEAKGALASPETEAQHKPTSPRTRERGSGEVAGLGVFEGLSVGFFGAGGEVRPSLLQLRLQMQRRAAKVW